MVFAESDFWLKEYCSIMGGVARLRAKKTGAALEAAAEGRGNEAVE